MRFLVVLLIFAFCSISQASNSFAGDWCKVYGDFTEAYQIRQDSLGGFSVKTYTIGNQSGELHGHSVGFLSMGASSLVFVLDDYDMKLTDLTRSFNILQQKKKLHFSYENGDRITFTECLIKAR
jgi:hypothetical protein